MPGWSPRPASQEGDHERQGLRPGAPSGCEDTILGKLDRGHAEGVSDAPLPQARAETELAALRLARRAGAF